MQGAHETRELVADSGKPPELSKPSAQAPQLDCARIAAAAASVSVLISSCSVALFTDQDFDLPACNVSVAQPISSPFTLPQKTEEDDVAAVREQVNTSHGSYDSSKGDVVDSAPFASALAAPSRHQSVQEEQDPNRVLPSDFPSVGAPIPVGIRTLTAPPEELPSEPLQLHPLLHLERQQQLQDGQALQQLMTQYQLPQQICLKDDQQEHGPHQDVQSQLRTVLGTHSTAPAVLGAVAGNGSTSDTGVTANSSALPCPMHGIGRGEGSDQGASTEAGIGGSGGGGGVGGLITVQENVQQSAYLQAAMVVVEAEVVNMRPPGIFGAMACPLKEAVRQQQQQQFGRQQDQQRMQELRRERQAQGQRQRGRQRQLGEETEADEERWRQKGVQSGETEDSSEDEQEELAVEQHEGQKHQQEEEQEQEAAVGKRLRLTQLKRKRTDTAVGAISVKRSQRPSLHPSYPEHAESASQPQWLPPLDSPHRQPLPSCPPPRDASLRAAAHIEECSTTAGASPAEKEAEGDSACGRGPQECPRKVFSPSAISALTAGVIAGSAHVLKMQRQKQQKQYADQEKGQQLDQFGAVKRSRFPERHEDEDGGNVGEDSGDDGCGRATAAPPGPPSREDEDYMENSGDEAQENAKQEEDEKKEREGVQEPVRKRARTAASQRPNRSSPLQCHGRFNHRLHRSSSSGCNDGDGGGSSMGGDDDDIAGGPSRSPRPALTAPEPQVPKCATCGIISNFNDAQPLAHGSFSQHSGDYTCGKCCAHNMKQLSCYGPPGTQSLEKAGGRACAECGRTQTSGWKRHKHIQGLYVCACCSGYYRRRGSYSVPSAVTRARGAGTGGLAATQLQHRPKASCDEGSSRSVLAATTTTGGGRGRNPGQLSAAPGRVCLQMEEIPGRMKRSVNQPMEATKRKPAIVASSPALATGAEAVAATAVPKGLTAAAEEVYTASTLVLQTNRHGNICTRRLDKSEQTRLPLSPSVGVVEPPPPLAALDRSGAEEDVGGDAAVLAAAPASAFAALDVALVKQWISDLQDCVTALCRTWTLEANEEGQGLTEEAVVGPSSSGGPAVAAAVAAALSCLESQPGTAATGLLLAAATGRVEGDSAVGAPAAEAPDEATCTEAATSSSEEMKAAAMEVMDAEAVAHKHLVVRGGGSSTGEQSTEMLCLPDVLYRWMEIHVWPRPLALLLGPSAGVLALDREGPVRGLTPEQQDTWDRSRSDVCDGLLDAAAAALGEKPRSDVKGVALRRFRFIVMRLADEMVAQLARREVWRGTRTTAYPPSVALQAAAATAPLRPQKAALALSAGAVSSEHPPPFVSASETISAVGDAAGALRPCSQSFPLIRPLVERVAAEGLRFALRLGRGVGGPGKLVARMGGERAERLEAGVELSGGGSGVVEAMMLNNPRWLATPGVSWRVLRRREGRAGRRAVVTAAAAWEVMEVPVVLPVVIGDSGLGA